MRQQTTVSNTTEQVALRTLRSDIAMLEHGAATPTPELLVITPSESLETLSSPANTTEHSRLRLVISLILTLAILAFGYFWLYPRIVAWLSPSIIP